MFVVGADLSQLGRVSERRPAADFVALGHRVFGRLRNAPVPTAAFVNGAAVGGGMELALHCDYRTLASNAAMLGQPEVLLGILPGWGGSQLLPRIIGPDNAVTVIVENPLNQNRMLKVTDAARLGVVDVVLDAADFLERSLAWFADRIDGESSAAAASTSRVQPIEDWDRRPRNADESSPGMRTHGAAPAAYRALDMIELSRTTDLERGLQSEANALTDLIMTHEFRAGVYAFDLTQKRARKPVGAPDPSLARSRHQGRHRRRRPDGGPAGAAVRAAAPRPRGDVRTSTRPGSTRAWPRSAARSRPSPARSGSAGTRRTG